MPERKHFFGRSPSLIHVHQWWLNYCRWSPSHLNKSWISDHRRCCNILVHHPPHHPHELLLRHLLHAVRPGGQAVVVQPRLPLLVEGLNVLIKVALWLEVEKVLGLDSLLSHDDRLPQQWNIKNRVWPILLYCRGKACVQFSHPD